ncbi:uncharacterized protein LOC107175415 [Citrus sinensis]|uniref:uncharacterized protein LOC107175415 n=1 Tax=Citrus sinensis TaxID=2711 RepID=UPI0022793CD5|nr:uncharacterized protein LOC107175415 [Citrus sinensis]
MACDEEVSWSLSSLSEGRMALSNDGQVATHPHHRQQIDKEGEVSALQRRLQESSIVVRSEQNGIKRRKLKSKVWDEFTKYRGEDGIEWAICSLCEKKFDGSSKKGTTHLKNHLGRCRAKIKFKGVSRDTDKPIKTRDSADINNKPVIDLNKNSFDAKGMTTLQVDLEEKETGIVARDQQNEKNGKKLKSKVWDEFTKYRGEDGKEWAKCSICEKEFDGSSQKGTAHLKNHLERCRANYKRKEAAAAGVDDKSIKTRDLAPASPITQYLEYLSKSVCLDAEGNIFQENSVTGIDMRNAHPLPQGLRSYNASESVRRHLLAESERGLRVSMSSNWTPPHCSRTSLYPCLTDNWGDLPLKEDDLEDMLVFRFLRDAFPVGWVP